MKLINNLKSYNFSNYYLRFLASINQTLFIYFSFLIINNLINLGLNTVTLSLLFSITITAAILITTLQVKGLWNSKSEYRVTFLGIPISIIIGLINPQLRPIQNLIPFLVVSFVCWMTAIRKFNSPISFIYTVKTLYLHTPILIIVNLLIRNSSYSTYYTLINTLTFVYIFTSIFLIYRLKFSKFNSTEASKLGFDLTLTVIITIIAFFLSLADKYILLLLIVIKNLLLTVLYDLMDFFSESFSDDFYSFIKRTEDTKEFFSVTDGKGKAIEKFFELSRIKIHIPSEFWYVLIGATIIILLLYLLRKNFRTQYNNKILFNETREFVIELRNPKNNLSNIIKRIKDKAEKSLKNISFRVNSSVKDKIRKEYKTLIQSLLKSKVIIIKNSTASNISITISKRFPNISKEINDLTSIYEEARYGIKEFGKNDLESFKTIKDIILKEINT